MAKSLKDLYLVYESANVAVYNVVVGPYANNVYTIYSKSTGDGILIDAADEHELLLQICNKYKISKVLETHGHFDHIQAVPEIREAGISVFIAKADTYMLPTYDELISDTQEITVGDVTLHAMHTPGHTPGSICFKLKDEPVFFSGDTLFPGGPGNTKLPGSNFKTIIESIETRIFKELADNTLVLPGHGAQTTIGTEKPHLDEWIQRGW
jgi:glyoxylase-like metal-dependent hydrolase (beta-lactamase superfamily II)